MSYTKNADRKMRKYNKNGVRLFLMTVPFILLTFAFSYMPLSGWCYAFFDYKAGFKLFDCNFVGFKHFVAPFENVVLRENMFRVLRNTFAMSGLGILTSFLPMFFAIMLSELSSNKFRKFVQTVTTIPNFISWVLVYSLAYAMFSVEDGFVNQILMDMGVIDVGINFLASSNHVWLTMWLYGVWKSLGWSAIMYVAAITSIDQSLYEAAAVDGANRFQKIRHIVIPSLLPTFFILLIMAIANFLNNGMDQYFVFGNPMNKEYIEVLDLYVYNQGMIGNNISYSTAIGIWKSFVSIVLLFSVNGLSKKIRGESIF